MFRYFKSKNTIPDSNLLSQFPSYYCDNNIEKYLGTPRPIPKTVRKVISEKQITVLKKSSPINKTTKNCMCQSKDIKVKPISDSDKHKMGNFHSLNSKNSEHKAVYYNSKEKNIFVINESHESFMNVAEKNQIQKNKEIRIDNQIDTIKLVSNDDMLNQSEFRTNSVLQHNNSSPLLNSFIFNNKKHTNDNCQVSKHKFLENMNKTDNPSKSDSAVANHKNGKKMKGNAKFIWEPWYKSNSKKKVGVFTKSTQQNEESEKTSKVSNKSILKSINSLENKNSPTKHCCSGDEQRNPYETNTKDILNVCSLQHEQDLDKIPNKNKHKSVRFDNEVVVIYYTPSIQGPNGTSFITSVVEPLKHSLQQQERNIELRSRYAYSYAIFPKY